MHTSGESLDDARPKVCYAHGGNPLPPRFYGAALRRVGAAQLAFRDAPARAIHRKPLNTSRKLWSRCGACSVISVR